MILGIISALARNRYLSAVSLYQRNKKSLHFFENIIPTVAGFLIISLESL